MGGCTSTQKTQKKTHKLASLSSEPNLKNKKATVDPTPANPDKDSAVTEQDAQAKGPIAQSEAAAASSAIRNDESKIDDEIMVPEGTTKKSTDTVVPRRLRVAKEVTEPVDDTVFFKYHTGDEK